MQDQIRDSVYYGEDFATDSANLRLPVFIETLTVSPRSTGNLYSQSLISRSIPDWYFIFLILIVSLMASARIIYGKFLNSVWISSYSYQFTVKTFKENGVLQKRFDFGLIILYLINASLFIYLLNLQYSFIRIELPAYQFVITAFIVLGSLILLRIASMRLTGYIFERSELFQGFLYHYFTFSKVLGMVLIPFLIAIPYTSGNIREVLIYTGISSVIIIQVMRLIRASVYVFKNVIFLFYLILYLCVLEILPVLAGIKLILSLAQV